MNLSPCIYNVCCLRISLITKIKIDKAFFNADSSVLNLYNIQDNLISFLQRKLNENAKNERKQLKALLQVNCVSHVDSSRGNLENDES